MRILIYIEPFPMRQTMDHNRDYAAAFAKMLVSHSTAERLNEFDVRIYANRETLAHAQDEVLAAKRFLLGPESREQDQFRSSLTEWPHKGLSTWTSLLKGEKIVTQEYLQIFEQIHSRFAFEVVVTIGENGAAKAFAASANLKHIIVDFSFCRPCLFDTAMFDPLGAGGSSLMAQVNVSTIRSIVGTESWSAPLDQSCVSALYAADLSADSIGPIDFTGQDQILRQGNARTALICLQNFDDPAFRAHSKFSSPAHMVETCLPELAENGIQTIVRPPPESTEGPGQAEAMEVAKQAVQGFSDKAIWLDRHSERVPDTRLYTLCDLVVTANGTAGFEATLFDKQVCVLGGAAYKPIGAFPKLDAAISRKFDNRTYLKNLAALRAFVMRTQFVARNEAFTFNTFADRLVQTLSAWSESESSPKRALEHLYARYEAQAMQQMKAAIDTREPVEPSTTTTGSTAEDTSNKTLLSWNKSVSRLTTRARQSLGRKILQSGLGRAPGTGPLASNALFAASTERLVGREHKLPDHPLSAGEEQAIAQATAALQKRRKSRATFAVIVHCFYRDITRQLMERLQTVEQKFDLFVSIPPFGSAEIKNIVRGAFPTAKIICLPNRGRDIWPLSFIVSELGSDKYESVLKLQTSKPHFESDEIEEEFGDAWMDYCLTCLLGERGQSTRIDALLSPPTAWTIAGPSGLAASTEHKSIDLEFDPAQALKGLRHDDIPHHWTYFRGGNYWIKLEALRQLVEPFSNAEAYPTGTLSSDCQLSDLAQYAFALAAHQIGGDTYALSPDSSAPEKNPAPSERAINESLRDFLVSSASTTGNRINSPT